LILGEITIYYIVIYAGEGRGTKVQMFELRTKDEERKNMEQLECLACACTMMWDGFICQHLFSQGYKSCGHPPHI
jgi:hypothetical protein